MMMTQQEKDDLAAAVKAQQDRELANMFGLQRVITSPLLEDDKAFHISLPTAWGSAGSGLIEDIEHCKETMEKMGVPQPNTLAMHPTTYHKAKRSINRSRHKPYGTCPDCSAWLFRVGSGYECAVCGFGEEL